jgi:hypothetical protein
LKDNVPCGIFAVNLLLIAGSGVGKVAIENIEPGMVLEIDVHDRSGRMLLGGGSELTQKHLVIFRTWGVLEADIAGQGSNEAADQVPADVDPLELAAAEQELAPLFRHTNRVHPAIVELMRLAALRKVQHGTV